MGHALLRPKSIRSKFSNFGGIEQLGPQGMFEEDAALKQVEALERGTLASPGLSSYHGAHTHPRPRFTAHSSSSYSPHLQHQSSDPSHLSFDRPAQVPAQTA
jgi:hypothetical protein